MKNLLAYIKNHPISYLSIVIPFTLVFIISSFLWGFIILKINAQYFGDMLLQQDSLRWVWLLGSVSLLYLTLKLYRNGPIENYNEPLVKYFGIWTGNAAISSAAAYAGILCSALIPVAIFNQSLPQGISYLKLCEVSFKFSVYVILLYFFYLTIMANSSLASYYKTEAHIKWLRPWLLGFIVCFFLGRVLDVVNIFMA